MARCADDGARAGALRALAAVTPDACEAFWARKRGDCGDDDEWGEEGEGSAAGDGSVGGDDEMMRLMGFGGFKRTKWS